MTPEDKLQTLKNNTSVESDEADAALRDLIALKLNPDGYKVFCSGDDGLDENIHVWAAQLNGITSIGNLSVGMKREAVEDSIAIHRNQSTTPLSPDDYAFRVFLGGAQMLSYGRMIAYCAQGFSAEAKTFARDYYPAQLQLIDHPFLRSQISSEDSQLQQHDQGVRKILQTAYSTLLSKIAADSSILQFLEWRDLERLLAEAFDGIGFTVELTPGSKDQGRDLVLRFHAQNRAHKYLVEVKHWRSGAKVGSAIAEEFLKVIVNEQADGGLIIAPSGFINNLGESITHIKRDRIRLAGEHKISSLARTYVRRKGGLYVAPPDFANILISDTLTL